MATLNSRPTKNNKVITGNPRPTSFTSYSINNAIIPVVVLQSIFDTNFYIKTNLAHYSPISYANITPFEHWVRVGIAAGLSPNPSYSDETYLTQHPEIWPYIKGLTPPNDAIKPIYNSALEHWIYTGYTTGTYPKGAEYIYYRILTPNIDHFNAQPYGRTIFTGTSDTLTAGDILTGNGLLSDVQLILNKDSAIATIKKMELLKFTATAQIILDASNFSDIEEIQNDSSIGSSTIKNLKINPVIFLYNIRTNAIVSSFQYIGTQQQTDTIHLKLEDVTKGPSIIFDGAIAGFVKFEVNSVGAEENILPQDSIVNTDISKQFNTLSVIGAQRSTIQFANQIEISTITANPPTTLKFSNPSSGAQTGKQITAQFNSPGSSIYFTSATTLGSNNRINFTNQNNTLGIILEAAPQSSIASVFQNLDSIDIIDTITTATSINLSHFSNNITSLILSSTEIATKKLTISGLANKSTIYVGSIYNNNAPLSQTAGHSFELTDPNDTLTYTITGTSLANVAIDHTIAVVNSSILNINLAQGMNYATGNGNTISVISQTVERLNLISGSIYGKYTINNDILNNPLLKIIDASQCQGSFNVAFTNTLQTAIGSMISQNYILGNLYNETMYGGAASDRLWTGDGGVTTATGNGGGDSYYYFCNTEDGGLTITDFQGTQSWYIDTINFCNLNKEMNGIGRLIYGSGQNNYVQPNDSTSIFTINTLQGVLNAQNNIIKYTGSPIRSDADFSKILLQSPVNDNQNDAVIPFIYKNSVDTFVHIGLLKFSDQSKQASSLTDIITLQKFTNIDYIDKSIINFTVGLNTTYQLEKNTILPYEINFFPGSRGDILEIQTWEDIGKFQTANNPAWGQGDAANNPVSYGNDITIQEIASLTATLNKTNVNIVKYTGAAIQNPNISQFIEIKVNAISTYDVIIPVLYTVYTTDSNYIELGLLLYEANQDTTPDKLVRAVRFTNCEEISNFIDVNFGPFGAILIQNS